MKAGDHIRISRDGLVEHAIDVGDRTVIHFAPGSGVKRSRLTELAPNGARVDVVTHAERVYPAKQVVARAFSRFSESAYAAMFSDSEAFAVWCKTGQVPPRASGPTAGAVTAPGTQRALAAATTAVSAAKSVKKIARAAKQAVKTVAGRAQEARPAKAAAKTKRAPARKAPARRAAAKSARPQARSAKPARKPAPARPARAAKTSKRGAAPRKAIPGKRGKASARRATTRGKRR